MHEKVEKTFTLVMLGTNTKFTPELKKTKKAKPTKDLKIGDKVADYPKGETLSIIASSVKTAKTAIRDNTNPIPYQADEVCVVNGPDTRGTSVGEKIAQGLVCALKAIERGQTTVNIIAHSRGAVESILICHELEAIQQGIATCNSRDDLIKLLATQQKERHTTSVPTNNTPDIIPTITTLLPAKNSEDTWFLSLKNNMPQTEVNFFAIDPVPGDAGYGLTWFDIRYFTLPRIVRNAQILYYENERTDSGFTPLFVERTPGAQQEIAILTMPGHHGTGSSGNHGSQRNLVVSPGELKTTHVQKLVIFKLLGFLTKHGTSFSDSNQLFEEHSALGRKFAIQHHKKSRPNGTEPISLQELDYEAIFKALYGEIVKRRDGYRKFNETCYSSWLGRLASGRRLLYKDTTINSATGHAYCALADKFQLETDYINAEHSRLMEQFFFKLFQMDQGPNKGPADLINRACSILSTNISLALGADGQALGMNIGQEAFLNLQAARQQVSETFKSIVMHVSQQYINDDWSKENIQKEQIFNAIIDTLETFKKLNTLLEQESSEKPSAKVFKEFTDELLKISLAGITHTIEHKHKALENEYNRLHQTTDEKLKLFFESPIKQFLLAQADEEAPVESDAPILPDIEGVLNAQECLALANYPIEAKIKHIATELTKNISSARTLNEQEWEALIDKFDAQFGDRFSDFATLYKTIEILIADLGGLRHKLPSETAVFDKCELSLRQKSSALIETAAQKFYKDRAPHHLLEKAPKNSFAGLVEQYAINQSWIADREQEKLLSQEHLIADLQNTISSLKTVNQNLQKNLATEKIRTKKLEQQLITQAKAKKHTADDLYAKKTRIQELKKQLKIKSRAKKVITQQLQVTKEHLEQLEQQLQSKTKTEENVAQNLPEAKDRIEELNRQLNTESVASSDIKQNLEAKETHDTEFQNNANDKKEAQLLQLIEEKLRPLTSDYLKNLEKSKDQGELKTIKIARVHSLIKCLDENGLKTKPSDRVRAFYIRLNEVAGELKTHRDGALFRFIRNVVIAAGILISGILPGLIMLHAYRRAGNSSLKSLSFWESTGATVTHKLKNIEPALDNEMDKDATYQSPDTSELEYSELGSTHENLI